ncbi:MAG: 30S ribosomal protein S9 [Planctomycetales bacterium]|nr:30S ribosomal protein S9 [Planctomycetales bacterium]
MTTAQKTDKYTNESIGTGRRKTSVARVRVKDGSGKIVINGRDLETYFPNEQDRNAVTAPLKSVDKLTSVDIRIQVEGGGPTGQAGACRLGIARALVSMDAELHDTLRDEHHLTRDSRMKERKKYGLRGARRGTQFSKR